jgi:hypothetical protein
VTFRGSSEDFREGVEAFGAKRSRDFAEMMPGEAISGRCVSALNFRAERDKAPDPELFT